MTTTRAGWLAHDSLCTRRRSQGVMPCDCPLSRDLDHVAAAAAEIVADSLADHLLGPGRHDHDLPAPASIASASTEPGLPANVAVVYLEDRHDL